MTTVFRSLLPNTVAPSERTTPVSTDTLLPAEAVFVAGSVEKRRADFATGRNCARRALAELGLADAPGSAIAVGDHRQPVWPTGYVGSITHCDGYYAAAAARRADLMTLGIDVEVHAPIGDDIIRQTCIPAELAALDQTSAVHWPTILFSAREAVFKAWFPLVGSWLGFHDVTIEIDASTGFFDVRFLGPYADLAARADLLELTGAIGWDRSFVYSAAWRTTDGNRPEAPSVVDGDVVPVPGEGGFG